MDRLELLQTLLKQTTRFLMFPGAAGNRRKVGERTRLAKRIADFALNRVVIP